MTTMSKDEFKIEFRRWVACWGLPPECHQDKAGGILLKPHEKAQFYFEQMQTWPIEQMRAVFDRLVQGGTKWFPSWPVVQECYDNLFPPVVKDDATEVVDASRKQFEKGMEALRRLPIEEYRTLELIASDNVAEQIKRVPDWLLGPGLRRIIIETAMLDIWRKHKGAKHEG